MKHLQTKRIAESGVFQQTSSVEEMVEAIAKYGKKDADYNDFVGAAYEVYCEFFFERYGQRANPLLGVLQIEDTSSNKYEVGIDFRYQDFSGDPAVMQVKYRSDPSYRFTRDDLSSFISVCDETGENGIPRKNRILFTSLEANDNPNDGWGIFHFSYQGGHKQMRVIGLNHQAQFIDRDPTFWNDFRAELNKSLIARSDFKFAPPMWEHQVRMNEACQSVIVNGGRGRVICATGGGKTRVIYQNVMDGFDRGFNVQVIVAPTIDLLRQHHDYFYEYGAFHQHGISVIHFRTGESSEDGWADISQTTNVLDAMFSFTEKTLVFVTYASEEKFFNGLRKENFDVDLVCWDEFHHTVQQTAERRDHMLDIPSARNLFYSASVKRGRLVCATNEEIYGPLLIEVKYSELRKAGILVPKINVKTVFIARDKIGHLRRTLKKEASKQNFDLATAVLEAGGTIAAYRDMRSQGKNCNAVTFSKAVPICKEITGNPKIREEFSCILNTVHAGVPGRERKKIYEEIKTAENSVLCQFSVVKEGIDINPFNCVVFSRNMDVIGTQQAIGRAVRAHPDDTKNLKAGIISIDSPDGWKKYEATVYVIMHNEDTESFKNFLIDMIIKLQFAGLDPDDYEFSDISEQRHGTNGEDDSWVVPTTMLKNVIDADSVKQAVNAAVIHLEEMQRQEEENQQASEYSKLPLAQRMLMLGDL